MKNFQSGGIDGRIVFKNQKAKEWERLNFPLDLGALRD